MNLHKTTVLAIVLLILLTDVQAGYVEYIEDVRACTTRQLSGWRAWGWGIAFIVAGPVTVLAAGTYCTVGEKLLGVLSEYVFEKILQWMMNQMAEMFKALIELFKDGVTYEIDYEAYDNLLRVILQMIVPFLFIQIVVVAAHMIFSAIDPGQRSKAKNMLTKLITALVLVAISKDIYKLLFSIINAVSESIFDKTVSLLGASSVSSAGFISSVYTGAIVWSLIASLSSLTIIGSTLAPLMVLIASIFMFIVVLIVFIRLAMITLFYIIFPFTLFLYFFEYTRSIGGNLLMKTIMWITMGPVMALILCITVMAMLNMISPAGSQAAMAAALANNPGAATAANQVIGTPTTIGDDLMVRLMAFIMFIGGGMSIIGVPFLMVGFMKWVGGALAGMGMKGMSDANTKTERWTNFSKIAVGGAMMGQGGGGMLTAASTAAYMSHKDSAGSGSMIPSSWGELKGDMKGFWSKAHKGSSDSPGQATGMRKQFSDIFKDHAVETSEAFSELTSNARYGTARVGAKSGIDGGYRSVSAPGAGPNARSNYGGVERGKGIIRETETDQAENKENIPSSMAGKQDTSTATGEYLETKGGKPTSFDEDTSMFATRGDRGEQKTTETVSAIVPVFNIMKRLDLVADGVRDIYGGVKGMGGAAMKGEGRSIGSSFGRAFKGVGSVLLAATPLSPFLIMRMVGRHLVSMSTVLLPPVMHPAAHWLGRRLGGMSFRNFTRTAQLDTQMAFHSRTHRGLMKQKRHREEELRESSATPQQISSDAALGVINGKLAAVESKAAAALDKMGYTKSMFADIMPEYVNNQAYQRSLNSLRKNNPDLYEAYVRGSRVTEADPHTTGTEDLWKRWCDGSINSPENKKHRDEFLDTADQMVQHHTIGQQQTNLRDIIKKVKDGTASADEVKALNEFMRPGDTNIRDLSSQMQASVVRENTEIRSINADKKLTRAVKRTMVAAVTQRETATRATLQPQLDAAMKADPRERGERQKQFYAVAFMRSNSIGTSENEDHNIAMQGNFIESNPHMFAWSGDKDGTGKLQRQRFLKVEGIYGGAAKNLQMIYRRSHYMRLTQEGLSHEEAIIRSAGVNLRLYEDRENNIYMGANDLTYLSKTIERQDWAMKHVMERGLRLKEPKAFWAKYIDEEDVDLKTGLPKVGAEIKERQMMLEEVAELTIEESQKARGEGIRAPDGTILATIGSNPSVHDGDRLVVAKVLDWTNEPHMIVKKKVGVNPDGSISYVEVDTKNAAVIADIRTNQADYKVVDPIQMKAGITQYREVTGVREDGAVQYRSWRHFGEITYQVDGGYSRKIYAASELVGRDNALAIASGVPTDKVLAMMNPDEKRAYLVKQGANTSEEVRFMSETEVVEAAKKERESQIKKLKKQQTTDAETLTRDAAVEASGILSISDPKGEYVAQAQRSIHIHKEHQEILAEALTKKEFSRLWEEMRKANNPITDAEDERQVRLQARRTAQAQIMALKTTVYQGSQATGIGVERLVVFDDENNVNTWMISDYKDSEKVVLSVNAAHMTEDFQGFIKTSQENEIPHELTHTPAHDRMRAYYLTDKEIKKLEEGGELEGVKDPARILAHKKDRRTYQTDVVGKDRKSHDRMLRYNGASTMRNAAEEVIADTTAGDPEALRQKYEMVLEYYAGRERLDARDRMNAARIAATARKRAVSSRGTEWTDLADDMDALVKRSTARRSHLRESAKLMAKRQMEEQKLIALGVNPTRIPAMPEIVKLDGQIGVIEHEIATETTLSPKYQFYQEAEEYYGRLYDHVTTSGGTP